MDTTAHDTLNSSRRTPGRRAIGWLSWFLGLALVGAVIGVALHFSQAREFLTIAQRATPAWLLAAVALQAGTYLAQGEVIRVVARAGGFPLRMATVYGLSLTKLFLDQALPSAGLSGSTVLAEELRRCGMPRPLVAASLVIGIVSFQAAYVVALVIALLIAAIPSEAEVAVVLVTSAFTLAALAWAVIVLALSGRSAPELPKPLSRLRPLRALFDFLRDADPGVSRSSRRLGEATAWQLAIFALDAATLWVLIRSLGVSVEPTTVFASFMFSSLLRAIGLVPGGLGTFEAMSVLSLKLGGVPVAVALAATLLFRGLSFWIPMLPGLWLYRRGFWVR
jgi:uncharacterized protein (TIRG00374 family)